MAAAAAATARLAESERLGARQANAQASSELALADALEDEIALVRQALVNAGAASH